MTINSLFLSIVLLLITTLIGLLFMGQGMFGSDELWGVGRTTGMIEIVATVFIFLNAQKLRKPSSTTIVVLMWIPLVLTIVVKTAENELSSWVSSELLPVLFWPLIYLFFFAYTKGNPKSIRLPVLYFQLMAVACSVLFFSVFRLFNLDRFGTVVQLNVVYYPLLVFPWLILVKKRWWRYLGMAFVMGAVFYSFKRTALVALSLAGMTYLIVEHVLLVRRHRLRGLILPAMLVVLSLFAFLRTDESFGGLFSTRLSSASSDEGSGRLEIYRNTIAAIRASSLDTVVMGHGHNSVVRHLWKSAHNDFLEVLFDYGIVCLILYVVLHGCLIRKAFHLIRYKSQYASAFATSYVIFFVLSMLSHLIIYPTYFIFLVALWGSIEGVTQGQSGSKQASLHNIASMHSNKAALIN